MTNAVFYPLYDDLVKAVEKRENKKIDVKVLCSTINKIYNNLSKEEAIEHYREIQVIILHYFLLNNASFSTLIPYDGKVMNGGKGILYQITNFPPYLQQILTEYIEYTQ